MGGWSGSNDQASKAALVRALELGCNFFDTALAYGNGHSETLIRDVLHEWGGPRPFVATKVSPKDRHWPGLSTTPPGDVFPYEYVVGMSPADPLLRTFRRLGEPGLRRRDGWPTLPREPQQVEPQRADRRHAGPG